LIFIDRINESPYNLSYAKTIGRHKTPCARSTAFCRPMRMSFGVDQYGADWCPIRLATTLSWTSKALNKLVRDCCAHDG